MPLLPYGLARPFLFGLDPEAAHELTMESLARTQRTPLTCLFGSSRVSDPITLAGLNFPNRVGMAAGLDKNARVIDALGAMGFGFVGADHIKISHHTYNEVESLAPIASLQNFIGKAKIQVD